MRVTRGLFVLPLLIAGSVSSASIEQVDFCRKTISAVKPSEAPFCDSSQVLQECGADGVTIHHSEYFSTAKDAKRILVMGVFHGDEPHTGSVPLMWFKRLKDINPRNSWRFVPVMNPVGLQKKTRVTGTGADLNRNFPTKDWGSLLRTNQRRNPGKGPASEWETKCALAHLESFKPDVVVAIHAPFGILDFDGPKTVPTPRLAAMPARRLGTYPGSLGRYLWVERGIPVVTVELPAYGRSVPEKDLVILQDWIGTVAKTIRNNKQATITTDGTVFVSLGSWLTTR